MRAPKVLVVIAVSALALTACAGDSSNNTDTNRAENSPTVVETIPVETSSDEVPVHPTGEIIELPGADIVFDSIEEIDMFETPEYVDDIVPSEGERLWKVTVSWTNHNKTVEPACSPSFLTMSAWTEEGVQLIREYDATSAVFENNECPEIMDGDSGVWFEVFRGKDKPLAWATVTNNTNPSYTGAISAPEFAKSYQEWALGLNWLP